MEKIDLNKLEDVIGGSKLEIKETLAFINEHYPDVNTSKAKELKAFLKTLGIVKVVSYPSSPNVYYDEDGNELNHEQFMQVLRDSVIE